MNTTALILTQSEIQQLVSMHDVVDIVEMVLKGHGEATVVMPPKITLDLGEDGRWPHYYAGVNSMPAYVGELDAAGIKFVGVFQRNSSKGLPGVTASIILIDPATGMTRAFLEGALITSLRTGAATGVAAKYLARSSSGTIAIIGAGAQGRTQLRGIDAAVGVEEVHVYDVRSDAMHSFADEMGRDLDVTIDVSSSVEQAVRGADVVVTATFARSPFLKREWLRPGALVSPIGSFEEIEDDVVVGADKVIVDSILQAEHRGCLSRKIERGVFSLDQVYCELGGIVAGKHIGREGDEEDIVFVPIGMGSEDVAVAHVVYERALEADVGIWVDLLA